MIVLDQSDRTGEWLIAATTPDILKSFRESFTLRRGVCLIRIPVPRTEPGRPHSSPVSEAVRLITQLSNGRVDLVPSSIVETPDPPPNGYEDPWTGRLKKASSEASIASKVLKGGLHEMDSTLGSHFLLNDAELSLEGRLSRPEAANALYDSCVEDPFESEYAEDFHSATSLKRRLNSDGFSSNPPTSPETNRLTALGSSLDFLASANSSSGYVSSPILGSSSVGASSSRMFQFDPIGGVPTSPFSPSIFHALANNITEVNFREMQDPAVHDDSFTGPGTRPITAGNDDSSRLRKLSGISGISGISEICEISLQAETVDVNGEITRSNEADISRAENCVDPQFTLDESQLEFDDDPAADGADSTVDYRLCPGGESDLTFFSCQGDNGSQDKEQQLQEDDDSSDNRSTASPFVLPSAPSIASIAKRNIRVEKISHLQYRCQWCNCTFTKASDCYYHFLVSHSKRKRKTPPRGKPRCGKCGFQSNSREDLRHHVSIRHEYACQFCKDVPSSFFVKSPSKCSTFPGRGRLAVKRHEECRHAVKDYMCLLCGKRFYYLVNLKAHARGCHANSHVDLAE